MDYRKIYINLINKCSVRLPIVNFLKSNKISGYLRHHINYEHLPYFIEDLKDPINDCVYMTKKEHALAHILIAKAYPNPGKDGIIRHILAASFNKYIKNSKFLGGKRPINSYVKPGENYCLFDFKPKIKNSELILPSNKPFKNKKQLVMYEIVYPSSIRSNNTKILWSNPNYAKSVINGLNLFYKSDKSKEIRAKYSAKMREQWNNTEFKEKMHKINKCNGENIWKDPEFIKRKTALNKENMTNRWNTIEYREKMAKVNDKRLHNLWQNEEYRKTISTAVSESNKNRAGFRLYTNGKETKQFKPGEEPEGWKLGRHW